LEAESRFSSVLLVSPLLDFLPLCLESHIFTVCISISVDQLVIPTVGRFDIPRNECEQEALFGLGFGQPPPHFASVYSKTWSQGKLAGHLNISWTLHH